jgi:tRNA pseudouridine32 synthase/23S rRNA pseudouridine746 synthase
MRNFSAKLKPWKKTMTKLSKNNYCILSDSSVTLQSAKFKEIKTIHEDQDFVFLTKPVGMANTGDVAGSNFYDYLVQKYGGIRYKPKILLSLDRIQGGISVIAKHFAAERHFDTIIKKELILHASVAIVSGDIRYPSGKVKGGAIRNATNSTRFSLVARKGTPVEVNYLTLAKEKIPGKEPRSTLCFHTISPHRHLIRLACSGMGASILGDELYRNKGKANVKQIGAQKLVAETSTQQIKEGKVAENQIPFYSCYLSFPKYVSTEYYELFLPPPAHPLIWTEKLSNFNQENIKKLFLMNDELKEVYIRR